MSGVARFWLRLGSEVTAASALLLFAGFAARDSAISPLVGIGGGFVMGLSLFLSVERTWKPPVGAMRRDRALLALSGLVLLLRSSSEEVFWRWFVLGGFALVLGAWIAAVLSTLGFALSHVEPRAVGLHLVTGSAFASAYVVTGSLVCVVAAHTTYNIFVTLGLAEMRHGGPSQTAGRMAPD